MFNVVLKSSLYLILATCVSWGAILISGPKIIGFFVNKTFGDNLRIYNLQVTPKLALVASRIEFANASVILNNTATGSVRGVELGWVFVDKLIPEIILTTGPILIDDSVSFKNSSAELDISNILRSGLVDFNFSATSLKLPGSIEAENIKVSGFYNYQTSNLKNVEISGKELEISNDLNFQAPSLKGTVVDVNFNQLHRPVSVNQSTLIFEELSLGKPNFVIKGVSAKFNFNGASGTLEVQIDNLSDDRKNKILENVELSSLVSSLNFATWDKINIASENLLLPSNPYYGEGSTVTNFSTVIKKNLSNEIYISSKGSFGDFEIISSDGFLANLSGANFTIVSSFEHVSESTKSLVSTIYLQSKSKPILTFSGEAAVLMSGSEYLKCITDAKCILKVQSDFQFEVEKNKLKGSLHCVLPGCYGDGSKYIFESENTSKFFESAMRSKIFNPLLLSLIYGNFSQGQKIGKGHILKF